MYNAIDDVAPQYLRLKHWKELIGAQRNWQSNCKYGKPVMIKGCIPAIILCNPGPECIYFEFLKKVNLSFKLMDLSECQIRVHFITTLLPVRRP